MIVKEIDLFRGIDPEVMEAIANICSEEEYNKDTVLKQMRGAVRSLSKELSEKETGIESARESLLRSGFSGDQVDYIFKKRVKSIADEIIETVTNGHYTALVLSRQPGKVTRLFARNLHNKVLTTLKDVTICIAT